MAIISVNVSDSEPVATKWAMPPNSVSISSPIPRGLITYVGVDPIAILGSGDETAYSLTLTMPPGFAYLPKKLLLYAASDGLLNSWEDVAYGFYARARDTVVSTVFSMLSPGLHYQGAATATKIYNPSALTPKLVLAGGDQMVFQLADMTSTSVAGDVWYSHDFYVFDVDQVDKWEVNTPFPTISHTSF